MLKKLIPLLIAASLSAGVVLAQTQSNATQGKQDQGVPMPMMNMMHGGKPQSEADRDYMGAMQEMHQSMMTMEMSGDPNKDFVRMMIPHHQSAIDISQTLLKQKDTDPELRKIATEIIAAQQKEIETFQKWLTQHRS
jgi:uncharacterized protein (DUF305 family)